MMTPFEDALHSFRGLPRVTDIRNCGILGAVEFEKGPADDPYKWPREVMIRSFARGVNVRFTGNCMAVSPPIIVEQNHLDRIVDVVGEVIKTL